MDRNEKRREYGMLKTGGDYSAMVRELLYDGKPHYDAEIMAYMARKIPPEIAMRVKAKRTTGNLMDKIISGIRHITHNALTGQEKHGLVVRETDAQGRMMWRLCDPDYLAIIKAVQEHKMAELQKQQGPTGTGDGEPKS